MTLKTICISALVFYPHSSFARVVTSNSVKISVISQSNTSNYATNFDLNENPISENGHWHKNQSNVFTKVQTANGIAFGTNGIANTYDDSYALLSGFGPNQTIEAVIYRDLSFQPNGITHEAELLLRFSDDSENAWGYECTFSYYGGMAVASWDGPMGSFTILNSTSKYSGYYGQEFKTGDVVKATITGNVITTYVTNVPMLEVIDSRHATGQPGIGFFIRPGGHNNMIGFSSLKVTSGN